jgi:hypothetical protein
MTFTNETVKIAIVDYKKDAIAAQNIYGVITSWDISKVDNVSSLLTLMHFGAKVSHEMQLKMNKTSDKMSDDALWDMLDQFEKSALN